MLTNYQQMPDTSKAWIYQANRVFSSEELALIQPKIELFLNSWKRHGQNLKASYLIKYNQFIVLFVDETFNNVSGCSIDASVNFIKKMEQEFSVDLTNKLNISFKDNNTIEVVSLADFQKYAQEGKITPKTVVFNNLAASKADFENNWEVEAHTSWHKRFLVQ